MLFDLIISYLLASSLFWVFFNDSTVLCLLQSNDLRRTLTSKNADSSEVASLLASLLLVHVCVRCLVCVGLRVFATFPLALCEATVLRT